MGNVPGGLTRDEIEQLQESTNCAYKPTRSVPSRSFLTDLTTSFLVVTEDELQRLYRKFQKIDTDG